MQMARTFIDYCCPIKRPKLSIDWILTTLIMGILCGFFFDIQSIICVYRVLITQKGSLTSTFQEVGLPSI